MPALKEHNRKVYEHLLGRALGFEGAKGVRPYQWKAIKREMREAGMPITLENLRFVAQIRARCPRQPFEVEAMKNAIAVATELGLKARGIEIKTKVFDRNPDLKPTRFYWVFRNCGFPFKETNTYEVSLLGEILYRVFRRTDGQNQNDSNKVKSQGS